MIDTHASQTSCDWCYRATTGDERRLSREMGYSEGEAYACSVCEASARTAQPPESLDGESVTLSGSSAWAIAHLLMHADTEEQRIWAVRLFKATTGFGPDHI